MTNDINQDADPNVSAKTKKSESRTAKAIELLKWITKWLHRNLFYAVAFAGGLVILLFVPQVFNLWYSDPPPSGSGAMPWILGWVLFAVFLAAAFLYFLASVYVVPRPPMAQLTGSADEAAVAIGPVSPKEQELVDSPTKKGDKWGQIRNVSIFLTDSFILVFVIKWSLCAYQKMSAIVEWMVSKPIRLFDRLHSKYQAALVGFAFLIASILLVTQIIIGSGESLSYFTGPLARNSAWWLLSIGIWATIYIFVRRWNLGTNDSAGRVFLLQSGRILLWLGFTYAMAELLWFCAGLPKLSSVISYRAFTVWVIVNIWGVAVVLASCLDYLDAHIEFLPVRIVAFILAVVFCLISRPAPNFETRILPTAALSPPAFDGYTAFEAKIRSIPDDQPVVIVAASGGGSRAAMFTALVFEFLARHPISHATSNNGAGEGMGGERCWADNIILISSVSGGSLATAHFVQRDCKKSEIQQRTRYTIQEELISRTRQNIEELREETPSSESTDPEFDAAAKRANLLLEHIEQYAKNGPSAAGSADASALGSSFVDEMCINFMAPILRRATTISIDRGQALNRFWEQQFHWQGSNNLDGFSPLRDPKNNEVIIATIRPLVLFNASDVAKGSRVVVGFPPLPPNAFGAAIKQATRQAPAEITHLYPPSKVGVTLASAVRLSSNFPWGFNPIVLKPTDEKNSQNKGTTFILDGGVSDNSGIDTIYELIRGLDETNNLAGKRVISLLRSREILILEIDSGAKPTPPSLLARLFSVLFVPIEGLENAAYTNADHAREKYLAEIDELLSAVHNYDEDALTFEQRDTLKSLPHNVLQLTIACNHFNIERPDKKAIMTAWALGPNDKANVIARFAFELSKFEAALEKVRQATPAFLMALRYTERLIPAHAAKRLTLDVELNKQFAALLPAQLTNANVTKLDAAQQNKFYSSIKPYQDAAQQLITLEKFASKDKSKKLQAYIKQDDLRRWNMDWQQQVSSKLGATARQQTVQADLPNEWTALTEAAPGPSQAAIDKTSAVQKLRTSAKQVEQSRRDILKMNRKSKEWFTKPPNKPPIE